MAVSESARNDLFNGLSELLGPGRAEALMTHLPAYHPSEIATKSAISDLRRYVDERFDAVDKRFDTLDQRLNNLGERVDRVLSRLAAGLFVIFATVMGVLGVVVTTAT